MAGDERLEPIVVKADRVEQATGSFHRSPGNVASARLRVIVFGTMPPKRLRSTSPAILARVTKRARSNHDGLGKCRRPSWTDRSTDDGVRA